MGLSARAIAPLLGVSHTAVNKRARRGSIPREPDGSFDLAKVQAAWDDNADSLQQQRGAPPRKHEPRTSPPPPPEPDGAEPSRDAVAPTGLALVQLEQAKIKLEMDQIDLAERKGKLIEADQIERTIEERANSEKQALLNWPSRVAPVIAAELGVDERLVRKALDDHICEFLTERSRVPTDD